MESNRARLPHHIARRRRNSGSASALSRLTAIGNRFIDRFAIRHLSNTRITSRTGSDSPSFQANISLSYLYTLTANSSLSPRIDYSYTGKQYASIFQNTDFYLLSSRSLLDLYLTYAWKSWEIQAYAHNVTNETYIAGIGGDNTPVDAFYGSPRTYGVSISTKF